MTGTLPTELGRLTAATFMFVIIIIIIFFLFFLLILPLFFFFSLFLSLFHKNNIIPMPILQL